MRLTNQRAAILEFLKGNDSHPTVEQVFSAVKRKLPRISKATVYQNLDALSRHGIIQEANIKGISRFEPNLDAHHHLICKDCGKIMDFASPELARHALKLAKRNKDLKADSVSVNFFGTCNRCSRKKLTR